MKNFRDIKKVLCYFVFVLLLTNNTIAQNNIDLMLLKAVKSNNFNETKKLIHLGANINLSDKNNANLLMWAVYKSDFKVVNYLLENGAKYKKNGIIWLNNNKTEYYNNILIIAVVEGKLKILELLINKLDISIDRNKIPVLHYASFNSKIKIIRFLLKKNININAKYTDDKATPLIYALLNKSLIAAKILINNGADVNIKNSYGWSPIYIATRNLNLDIIKLLLEKKVDVNAQTQNGGTPLILAVKKNNTEIAKILLMFGAEIQIKDKYNKSAIDYATNMNNKVMLNILNNFSPSLSDMLDLGFDDFVIQQIKENDLITEQIDLNGQSLLHKAVIHKNYNLASILISKNFDINIEDKNGFSPFWYAITSKNKKLIELFKEKRKKILSQKSKAEVDNNKKRRKRFRSKNISNSKKCFNNKITKNKNSNTKNTHSFLFKYFFINYNKPLYYIRDKRANSILLEFYKKSHARHVRIYRYFPYLYENKYYFKRMVNIYNKKINIILKLKSRA